VKEIEMKFLEKGLEFRSCQQSVVRDMLQSSGHIEGMDGTRIPRRAFELKSKGKSPMGDFIRQK
jgi:hypothetical protein